MKKVLSLLVAVMLLVSCVAMADWDVSVFSAESLRFKPIELKLVPADNLDAEPVITISVVTDSNCNAEAVIEGDEAWFVSEDGYYYWDAASETPWTVTKDGAEYVWVVDEQLDAVVMTVVAAPEDGENGEISLTLMSDWTWDFTVVRDDGVNGTFTLNRCPDLGWGWNADMVMRYCDKPVVVDAETTAFTASFFVPSTWVVDQSQDWYKWATDARLNGIALEFVPTQVITEHDGDQPEDINARGAITLYVHKLVLE